MTTVSQNADTSPLLYFRQSTGQLQSSSDNTNWANVSSWPVTINNTGSVATLQVLFPSGLTITGATQNFICGSQRIQFGSRMLTNGLPTIINITNSTGYAEGYSGFLQNGTIDTVGTNVVNGFSNIFVFNLHLNVTGTGVMIRASGWLCARGWAAGAINNWVVSCSSNGNLNQEIGGLVGGYAATNNGRLTVIGCTFNGDFQGASCGGIVGPFACRNGGTLTVDRCFCSSDLDSSSAAGIVGEQACGGTGTSNLTISNCGSTGILSNQNAAGILGSSPGGSSGASVLVTRCFSTGNMTANFTGGIISRGAKRTTVTNCFTTGNMTSSAANGIIGDLTDSSVSVSNCYTSGTGILTWGRTGITSGSAIDNITSAIGNFSNNYSEANNTPNAGDTTSWNGTRAAATLNMAAWLDISSILGTPNTPFILRNALASPYEATNILANADGTFAVDDTFALSGGVASPATVVSTTSNRLIATGSFAPTVNNSTGVISAVTGYSSGTYTALVYSVMSVGYSLTTIILSIPFIIVPPFPVVTKLTLDSARIKGASYELRNELKMSAGLLEEPPRRILTDTPKFASNADYTAWKKARANAAYRQITLGL